MFYDYGRDSKQLQRTDAEYGFLEGAIRFCNNTNLKIRYLDLNYWLQAPSFSHNIQPTNIVCN